jgi:hypothetical protein
MLNNMVNINGPFVQGTNRYDVPDEVFITAVNSGKHGKRYHCESERCFERVWLGNVNAEQHIYSVDPQPAAVGLFLQCHVPN